jgi:hypothetical protein
MQAEDSFEEVEIGSDGGLWQHKPGASGPGPSITECRERLLNGMVLVSDYKCWGESASCRRTLRLDRQQNSKEELSSKILCGCQIQHTTSGEAAGVETKSNRRQQKQPSVPQP